MKLARPPSRYLVAAEQRNRTIFGAGRRHQKVALAGRGGATEPEKCQEYGGCETTSSAGL